MGFLSKIFQVNQPNLNLYNFIILQYLYLISVVTIYATLGDEAIAHGINETEVTTVITSHELLPKFKYILELTPRVNTIIFMEDQLKKTDVSGYKEGIRIIPFQQVIQTGKVSSLGKSLYVELCIERYTFI